MIQAGAPNQLSPALPNMSTKGCARCALPKVVLVVIAMALLLSPVTIWANSCAAAKPTKVFGEMQGVVINQIGERAPGTELFFKSETGTDKIEVHADASGKFKVQFSSLPHGIYRVTTNKVGHLENVGEVQVTGWKPEISKGTLVVEISTTACMGGISRGKAPRP